MKEHVLRILENKIEKLRPEMLLKSFIILDELPLK